MPLTRRSALKTMLTGLPALAADSRMKITSVRAAHVPMREAAIRRGVEQALFTSDFDPAKWRFFGGFSQLSGAILVEVKTDAGITGYGLGGGGTASLHLIDNHLKHLFLGANPLNIELLWDQTFASTSFYGRRGLPVMALSGLDLALWDIAGKHAGVPVHRLLGGLKKPKVRAYFTLGDLDQGIALGFTAFKVPVTAGPPQGEAGKEATVKLLTETRRKIGPDALLMIDCLARWDIDYTLEMAERLAPVKLHFIEEPLYPDDYAGNARLCREVKSTRIASGEHEFTHYGFRELIGHKAAQILQPDLTWGGGLTAGRRIAALANEAGLPLMPHRGGSSFAIHLVLTEANATLAESFGIGHPSGHELMELMSPPVEKGYYLAPERPGLGFEMTPALLKKYAPPLAL
ncbi:MAG: hypothetical protein FJW40_11405 [Acidobacteria bacterium]|nr:hypothetical protein [Acidobacteriota bacterium]